MEKIRATRHNGRAGKGGVYDPKHNDRSHKSDYAEHIDNSRSDLNVYWDCYQGYNIADQNGVRPERKYSFDQIEYTYYFLEFGDSIEAQNERHRKSRHKERIRPVKDILKDSKTCPEESIYQLGTKDGHEDAALFAKVVAELFEEIMKRYGSHFQILDWALHMDEKTPHIHERHVFFADDGYGMNFPKQEKACEAMGFELPYPDKKPGKNNNRKMSFDSEIRKLYIEIAQKYGITIEKIPLEGKVHLEKNDFIIAKQNEEIAANEAHIAEQMLRISDIDSLVEDVAEKAYEKACEVVTETVKEETIKEDIAIVSDYKKWVMAPERKMQDKNKNMIKDVLDVVMKKLSRNTAALLEKVRNIMTKPEVKRKNKDEIAKVAKESILEKLRQGRLESEANEVSVKIIHKDRDMGER